MKKPTHLIPTRLARKRRAAAEGNAWLDSLAAAGVSAPDCVSLAAGLLVRAEARMHAERKTKKATP